MKNVIGGAHRQHWPRLRAQCIAPTCGCKRNVHARARGTRTQARKKHRSHSERHAHWRLSHAPSTCRAYKETRDNVVGSVQAAVHIFRMQTAHAPVARTRRGSASARPSSAAACTSQTQDIEQRVHQGSQPRCSSFLSPCKFVERAGRSSNVRTARPLTCSASVVYSAPDAFEFILFAHAFTRSAQP